MDLRFTSIHTNPVEQVSTLMFGYQDHFSKNSETANCVMVEMRREQGEVKNGMDINGRNMLTKGD